MVLSFYKKNKLWDREGIELVYPTLDEAMFHYMGTDVFDRPCVGDIVILDRKPYKVFNTIVDYRQKEIFVIVEEPHMIKSEQDLKD